MEALGIWAFCGHLFWLRYELDHNFGGDGPILDLIAMVGLWVLGPLCWMDSLIFGD